MLLGVQPHIWDPPANCMKINIDALFKKETVKAGIGLIIRDCAGSCFGDKRQHFDGGLHVDHEVKKLECMALKELSVGPPQGIMEK